MLKYKLPFNRLDALGYISMNASAFAVLSSNSSPFLLLCKMNQRLRSLKNKYTSEIFMLLSKEYVFLPVADLFGAGTVNSSKSQ